MVKAAASDYDGTLLVENQVSPSDLAAIKKWRAAGHLFGLATGRDVNLLSYDVFRRGIPFDFLICSTGATAYDQNLNLLWRLDMPDQAWRSVIGHPALLKSRYCLFSQGLTSYINCRQPQSWLTSLGLPMVEISLDEAGLLSGIQQIGLEYDSPALAGECLEELRGSLRGIYGQLSGFCLDLMVQGADKAAALAALFNLRGWIFERVLTIGDSENDLSMIRRFGGYAISQAPEPVRAEAAGTYHSVGDMLLDNLG